MNAQLKELLDKEKARIIHSLNLVNKSKTVRTYTEDYRSRYDSKYDEEKKQFFIEDTPEFAISDFTDEEFAAMFKYYESKLMTKKIEEILAAVITTKKWVTFFGVISIISIVVSIIALIVNNY